MNERKIMNTAVSSDEGSLQLWNVSFCISILISQDLPASFRGLVADVDLQMVKFCLPVSLEYDSFSSPDHERNTLVLGLLEPVWTYLVIS